MLWNPENPCARISGDGTSDPVGGGLSLPGQSSLPRGTAPLAPVGGCIFAGLAVEPPAQPRTPRRKDATKPASANALDARFMAGPLPVSHLRSATYVCQVDDL